MKKEYLLEVENLSKKFIVHYEKPALIYNILPFLKSNTSYETIWSLKNINFKLEKGKCYGLIGHNGSGKTTLLKTLAGIINPDKGKIIKRGKISNILELGAGFHPELTGKENIYLNSSLLGLNKKQIDEKYEKIVKFAGLDKFIDSKIKIYSSGMYLRLGFSIAIQADFEIMFVDEIIAVGDKDFQKKCIDKIIGFKNSGKTILLASHNLESLKELADYLFWMEKGEIIKEGITEEVLKSY